MCILLSARQITIGCDMVPVRRRRGGPQAEVSEEIVEEGDIYFAYRPRIDEDSAEGLADIQRFYMVMKPEGRARLRAAVLGRKRLPEARDHERIWGFIEAVKSGPAVENEFREHHYATKTRGERTPPPVRAAGEGVYALIKRGRNLHLTYELELPQRSGEVQEELNIERQAAYILSKEPGGRVAARRRTAGPGTGALPEIARTGISRPALCLGRPASPRLRRRRVHPGGRAHRSGARLCGRYRDRTRDGPQRRHLPAAQNVAARASDRPTDQRRLAIADAPLEQGFELAEEQ
ncbi:MULTISPECIES: hypothetical protein [unclassified Bradyrhizobium]|uniref:hypothetical protein n=1 Tax=unclassified Bradyrhizobium TaxID=2631580 RepID=UPI001FFA5032|nr:MULTISPECIES: hypothetical protein [unclassified Bradyrhizobium]MCK1710181.1 hypothetical protein [Bradyrhizobium sp. 143]MCK1726742.1 hypothetical protein [Bradyrhizobium sp. 142]